MKPIRIAAALIAGGASLAALPAYADAFSSPKSASIAVSLTVEEECTIGTTPLAFGTTGIVDTNVETTATITVQCTAKSPYAIGLDAGANAGDTDVTHRKLANTDGVETATLNYQLYSDGGFSHIWGHTIGTDTVNSTPVTGATGADETFTVHARVPTHQNVPAGDYADTVTATIWYADDLN